MGLLGGRKWCGYCLKSFPVIDMDEVEKAISKVHGAISNVSSAEETLKTAKNNCGKDAMKFGSGEYASMESYMDALISEANSIQIDGDSICESIYSQAQAEHNKQEAEYNAHVKACAEEYRKRIEAISNRREN